MEIRKVKISEMKSPEYNPRKSVLEDPVFLERLTNSLERFGYIDPIIWNERTGNVVGGNQRLAVLSQGMSPEEELTVVVVDFDETEERAANIALNKVSGDWMETKLAELMQDIKAQDPGMLEYTGYDLAEGRME